MQRREFIHLMGLATAAGLVPGTVFSGNASQHDLYDVPMQGDLRLLHFTDCHGQLNPVYFREPNVNLGVGQDFGKAPHLVGDKLLTHYGISKGSLEAHAFTHLDFSEAARRYGKVGGFAHMATLINQLREQAGSDNTLLLDGGDTWQGSGLSLKTKGQDMVGACNKLGVDVMTGHWEYTFWEKDIRANLEAFNGEFVANNVRAKEESILDGAEVSNEETGHVFKPYVMKTLGKHRVAVIGQSFPYTPVANPAYFIPDWTFGIQDEALQSLVNTLRATENPDAIVLLSHNGMDVDLKMASRVSGIDVIFGGHTHDGVPAPVVVKNATGKTLVTNAGSNGKFVASMDLKIKNHRVVGYHYRLLPVFSRLLTPDADMASYIKKARLPYESWLQEPLGVSEELLYRRGNFMGSFDQLTCDSLREVLGADIAFSPGFRWGTSILPGQSITREHILDQTATNYSNTYVQQMEGQEIKAVLEDVADNLFHPDPYLRQGGDMVRVGGMHYQIDPLQSMGKRISNMTLASNGEKIHPKKCYLVAGWAGVKTVTDGAPVWEVIEDYLLDVNLVKNQTLHTPSITGVKGNPGIQGYAGDLL